MSKKSPKITVAMALPNDRTADARIGPDGKPMVTVPGLLRLTPALERTLTSTGPVIAFPPKSPYDPNDRIAAEAVLNLGGDFDAFSEAHFAVSERFTPDTPIFNNPLGVAMSRKDLLANRLGGIDGLHIPRVIRVKATAPDSLQSAFADANLRYPVTVQSTTTPDNRDVVVIQSDADWPKATNGTWAHKLFYITELGDAPLAQHIRLKVCFVGAQLEMIKFPFAYPPRPLAANADTFARIDERRLGHVLKSLFRGIPLDYWTAEMSVLPSGDFRMEHIWVGLPLRDTLRETDAIRALWRKVAPKLDALVGDTSKWRHSLEKAAHAAKSKH